MQGLLIPIAAMAALVGASNFLVQFPVNDWLTWGALTYPFTFLVTDLSNRHFGPQRTRRVVYIGFAAAVALSAVLATPRIALASGTAFLVAQLLDIFIFHRLRNTAWWLAPLGSSVIATTVDTFLFFGLAFVATPVPWVTLATGDLGVKIAMAVAMLVPFRLALLFVRPGVPTAR